MFYQHCEEVDRLMPTSTDGGKQAEMETNPTTYPRVSPDGKQILYLATLSYPEKTQEGVEEEGRAIAG
jgi:hypothetical protein